MKYIVYHWPSLHGTPRYFRTWLGAFIHRLRDRHLFGTEMEKL